MGRTIAEMFIDKGRVEGERKGRIKGHAEGRVEGVQEGSLSTARAFLLATLRKRFKKVPRKIENRISTATDLRQLATWLEISLEANTIAEVGIPTD